MIDIAWPEVPLSRNGVFDVTVSTGGNGFPALLIGSVPNPQGNFLPPQESCAGSRKNL